MPEQIPTRSEVLMEGVKVIVPRAALGALAIVGGAYLLWGFQPEPSPQDTPTQLVQPPSQPHETR